MSNIHNGKCYNWLTEPLASNYKKKRKQYKDNINVESSNKK